MKYYFKKIKQNIHYILKQLSNRQQMKQENKYFFLKLSTCKCISIDKMIPEFTYEFKFYNVNTGKMY